MRPSACFDRKDNGFLPEVAGARFSEAGWSTTVACCSSVDELVGLRRRISQQGRERFAGGYR